MRSYWSIRPSVFALAEHKYIYHVYGVFPSLSHHKDTPPNTGKHTRRFSGPATPSPRRCQAWNV